MTTPLRKLLVLDLDETLMHGRMNPQPRPYDFRIGPFFMYKRPGVDAFVARCREWFDIGVWSSASPHYVDMAVHMLFGDISDLRLVWASDRCTTRRDPETGQETWLKDIRKLTRRGFAKAAIIAVDDSPEKWSASYGNLVHVRPYLGQVEDDELPMLERYLDTLRGVPDVRNVEKRWWRRDDGDERP